MSNTLTNVSKGRPAIKLTWPDNIDFTIADIYKNYNEKVSKVTIGEKVHKAVKDGTIKESGIAENKRGRKAILYRLNGPLISLPEPVLPSGETVVMSEK